MYTLFFTAAGNSPSLRMTQNKLSDRRTYPRNRSRCHGSNMPSLGLRRRISGINFSSTSVCWLGWLCAAEMVGQGLHCPVPAGCPEVYVRLALEVLPAGTADDVLLCIFHQRMLIRHVLCCTLAREGYGPISSSWCVVTQL